jgi:hydroxypyruvate reductase
VSPRKNLRRDAERIWSAALQAVDPEAAVRRAVRLRGDVLHAGSRSFDLSRVRKVWAIGAGKAAAPMALALEQRLGPRLEGGLLVTKYGHSLPLGRVRMLESGHPLPDANGIAAAGELLRFITTEVRPRDLVFCLLSGGGSALLPAPAADLTLEDKLVTTDLLLRAGATIHEMNAVRKHLSSLKGGGMARLLAGTPVVSLILSDVVGDDLDTIASGPLSPDRSTFVDCRQLLDRLGVWRRVPARVRTRIQNGAAGNLDETPKPGDPAFRHKTSIVVGSNTLACQAAAREARKAGYRPLVLTSRLEGDTGEAARFHMAVAREIEAAGAPVARPACVISGGETTVRVRGNGRGGRNQEFVLQAVRALARMESPCLVASLGTDGTDGPTDAAGAVADNSSLARSLKHSPTFLDDCLRNNDSYEFFRRLGDLVMTGPTRTNVMDLHLILLG